MQKITNINNDFKKQDLNFNANDTFFKTQQDYDVIKKNRSLNFSLIY